MKKTIFNLLLKEKEKILNKNERRKNRILKKIRKEIRKDIKKCVKKKECFFFVKKKETLNKKNIFYKDILNILYQETNYTINDFFKIKEEEQIEAGYYSWGETVEYVIFYTKVNMQDLFIEYGKELYGK